MVSASRVAIASALRASEWLRENGICQLKEFVRRTDGTLSGLVRISRITSEYQPTQTFSG